MGMDLGRVVTFSNITDNEFTHLYHGQPFTIKAGESLLFPYDLGRHLAKHLARKILFSKAQPADLKNDRALFSGEDENSLIGKILGDESRSPVAQPLTEAEILRKRVEDLNANKPEGAPSERTKVDVINELEALVKAGKIESFDKRLSMAKLEEQLAEAKK